MKSNGAGVLEIKIQQENVKSNQAESYVLLLLPNGASLP